MTLRPPPDAYGGTSYVTKLDQPDKDLKENSDKEDDALFALQYSYLVFNAKKDIDRLITAHKKELTTYNKQLSSIESPFRIRVYHTTTVRGKKYVYCGRYVYKRETGKSSEQYVGRLDYSDFRNLIGKDFYKVGSPPSNILDNLKFSILIIEKKESNHILIPADLYSDSRYLELFAGKTVIKTM